MNRKLGLALASVLISTGLGGVVYGIGSQSITNPSTQTPVASPQATIQSPNSEPQDKITQSPDVVTETIPFSSKTVEEPTLEKGATVITQEGKDGTRKITYLVHYTNGAETSREKTNETIVTQPKEKITAIGTKTYTVVPTPTPKQPEEPKPPSQEDSVDYDCGDFSTHAQAQSYFNSQGGSPNNNVDRLDADNDGLACESLP